MPLLFLPIIGSWLSDKLLGGLGGRITRKGADIVSALVCVAIAAGILFGLIYLAISAIRSDARSDLLADQAEEQRIADEAQRVRETAAADARNRELAAGTATDAKQQKEITDATQDLPDTRPSARQRARVCVELQQQDRAAGRHPRSC
ncbi:MAG TPA: hypothetical protein VEZ59_06420 [Sphingopyxis sp.]|nr:hypothetical protein [Sphingopyxis sp.]